MRGERASRGLKVCLGMLAAVSRDPLRELGPRLAILVFLGSHCDGKKAPETLIPSVCIGMHPDARRKSPTGVYPKKIRG